MTDWMRETINERRPPHLPECESLQQELKISPCICRELRACEQRVFDSGTAPSWAVNKWREEGYAAGMREALTGTGVAIYEKGRGDGLDAAREAVAASQQYTDDPFVYIDRVKALAAIDALKGASDD